MTELQKRFERFIVEQQLCQPSQHRILVGVSGGKDSMLLLHLLVEAGFQMGVAHCNFRLRGQESDMDEALVRDYTEKLGLPFYVQHFDTAVYASERGLSIQMAARDLRYEWFERLRQEQGFDLVAVAHHATDNVETVLINQLRGTGIRGMCGMQPTKDHLIRPMLFFRADEVAQAVEEYQLPFRDDQSNFSTDYTRNKIRLDVLPHMREINPGLEHTFEQNMFAMREVRDFLDEQVEGLRVQCLSQQGELEILQLDPLLQYRSARLLLYELLRPYGFSPAVVNDLVDRFKTTDALQSGQWLQSSRHLQSGQQFYSTTHQLLLDRNRVFIRTREGIIAESSVGTKHRLAIEISDIADLQLSEGQYKKLAEDPTKAYFDADRVPLPLQIRQWREGDVFRPFGMGGKHKKLSDFFTGLKLSRWEKEEVPVVIDAAGNIIWVIPYRVSSDYNICDTTQNVMVISYFCQNG